MYDLLIVGAGLTGSLIADSQKRKKKVIIVDCLPHIGGRLADHTSLETTIPSRGTFYLEGRRQDAVKALAKHASFSRVKHKVPGYFEPLYPQASWSHTVSHLLCGTEVILGLDSHRWTEIKADKIVYTGRLDLLPWPALSSRLSLGSQFIAKDQAGWLDWEELDINQQTVADGPALQTLGNESVYRHSQLTGGLSNIATIETVIPSYRVPKNVMAPLWPADIQDTKAEKLIAMVTGKYPHITLAGGLARYKRFDLADSILHAVQLGSTL